MEPDLAEELKRWEESTLSRTLSKHPERRETFTTGSGNRVERLYLPEGPGQEEWYLRKLGFPGDHPFTRGVQPTMYRGRFWTMRQYAGFGTAEESNARYRFLLGQGQTGLSVAFDLPTQIGYDSDNPLSAGEIGKVGVAVDTMADMEILFDDIPLGEVSTSMTINSPAAILLAAYIAVAEKRGVAPAKLRGTIQNDILKEYIARGTYIFPPRHSMRLTTDIFAFCRDNLPSWNTISISGYHIRESGSTAAQEVGFTLANGMAYVSAAMDAGLEVDDFAPRLSFFFSAHNDLLEEVAKFRAARRLWGSIMRDRFGARSPRSMMLRFHTQTGGSTLTAQQVDNNVVRVAVQTLAAVLGGTQSLHTNSRDEALALPTEDSVRLALRTQQIVAHESGVAGTIDPLGGSYYVERLTDSIEEAATGYIDRIDSMGGMVEAIEMGYPQREIQEAAYGCQREIEAGDRIIVGLNRYAIENERLPEGLLRVDPSVEESQRRKLRQVRESRDNDACSTALRELREAASTSRNLMPLILSCVRCYATLGEVCDVLREAFGEYNASTVL